MNDKYRATPQELESQIKLCPPEVLAKLLTVILNQCIKQKVFQEKPVHKVVETLEGNIKGWR